MQVALRFLNISYTHWLDRAGQWAGSLVISTHCTVIARLLFAVTRVAERTLPTSLLMA